MNRESDTSYNIYLVEDEESLNEILTFYMGQEGWQVRSFNNGKDAQEMIEKQPDLWVLDIMLPDIDGIQLLKEIKEKTPLVPVIFMSARNTDMDRIMGLELGSDDYISKPFLPRELIIRIHKILERTYRSQVLKSNELTLVDGYHLDRKKRIVFYENNEIILTTKEIDMLLYLIDSNGQALSREQILQRVWGDDAFYSDRVVDNIIKRLRKKMPLLKIETIYGYGYRRC